MYNILPLGDIVEHVEDTTCYCNPHVFFEGGEIVVTHYSFDRREWSEYLGVDNYHYILEHGVDDNFKKLAYLYDTEVIDEFALENLLELSDRGEEFAISAAILKTLKYVRENV